MCAIVDSKAIGVYVNLYWCSWRGTYVFGAHFEIPEASEARSFQINFDNEDLTGIVNIERQSLDVKRSAGTWYSLDGRKLSTEPLQKGVYIHNGKKIIIK